MLSRAPNLGRARAWRGRDFSHFSGDSEGRDLTEAWLGGTGQGVAGLGKAWIFFTFRVTPGVGPSRGRARRSRAGQGEARHGVDFPHFGAEIFKVGAFSRRGEARHGRAMQGGARQGMDFLHFSGDSGGWDQVGAGQGFFNFERTASMSQSTTNHGAQQLSIFDDDPISEDELAASQWAAGRRPDATWVNERLKALAEGLTQVRANLALLPKLGATVVELAEIITPLSTRVIELDTAVASLATRLKVPSCNRMVLHCVRWQSHPDQPSWLLTEGRALTDAVNAAVVGFEDLPGGPVGKELVVLVVDELVCTFDGDVLQVRWSDGHVETLGAEDDLCGRSANAAIRAWADHPWRTVDERLAASRFLTTP